MEGDSGNKIMSEHKETDETLVYPTVGSDCLVANYVSSHYDVHICMRTGGHVITTRAAVVCGKIRVDHRERGLLPAAPPRNPQKCVQWTKFPSSSVSHHVIHTCLVIPSFSNVTVELC